MKEIAYTLKHLSGLSLIKKVKQISPLTPAILLTGEDPVSVKKKSQNNKVDLIVFKPFKIEEIEEALLRIIGNKMEASLCKIVLQ
jgi:DNA-binding response OmpR family regulator